MFIRLRVQNFKSFRDEAELSLVAADSGNGSDAQPFETPYKTVHLLPVAGIYGANAAGKTNLLQALSFMQTAVVHSQRDWDPEGGIPRPPFRLEQSSVARPSLFEIDAFVEGVRYQYGFEADSKRVIREWLYAFPHKKRQKWFVRDVEQSAESKRIDFGDKFTGPNRTIERVTRPNSLFLSAAAQNNHELVTPLYRWFAADLRFVHSDNRDSWVRQTAELIEEESALNLVQRLLNTADLGISGVRIEEQEVDEKTVRIVEAVSSAMDVDTPLDPEDVLGPRILLLHEAQSPEDEVPLSFTAESSGTRALFALTGAIIRTLRDGGVLCIDELDSSLHPILAAEVVRIFANRESNPNRAQLIFNTQDTNLLDDELLRPDEVWFVEKDGQGASHLYPLSDFELQKDSNLERGYLQGRFGAVPVLSSQRFLSNVGTND